MIHSTFLSAALFILQPILAETLLPVDPSNHFIWPPLPGYAASDDSSVLQNNIVIEYGAPQQSKPFSWVSNITSLSIVLWQEQFLDVPKSHKILDCKKNLPNNATNTLYWDGELGQIDISLGNVMFLHAYECGKLDSWKFASHYFNLTKASVSSTTVTSTSISGTSRPTQSPTTTITTSSGAPVASPTVLTSVPEGGSSAPGSTPSTAVLAGGVIAGAAGGLLLAAIAFFLWKNSHKQDDSAAKQQPAELPSQQGHHYDPQAFGGHYKPGEDTSAVESHGSPAEMYQTPPEMSADDYGRRGAAEMQ